MSVYINLLPRKTVRERVWKTLNVVVGITTILNVSMVGALMAPKAVNATGGYTTVLTAPAAGASSTTYSWQVSGEKPESGKEISHVTFDGCWTKAQINQGASSASQGDLVFNDNGSVKIDNLADNKLPVTLNLVFTTSFVNSGTTAIDVKGGTSNFTSQTSGPNCNPPVGQCELTFNKTVANLTHPNGPTVPGDILKYTLEYQNTGAENCTGGGVRIDDMIPAGTTYNGTHDQSVLSGDTGGDGINFGYSETRFSGFSNPSGFNGSYVSWNAHVVSPQETGTITFQVTVNSQALCTNTTIENKAKISADQFPNGIWSNGNMAVTTSVSTPCQGSIAGQKFEDMDGDGTKDAGETGLAGWTIYLDANGNDVKDSGEISTVTNTSGNYSFANLTVATYRVREVQPDYWTRTTDNPNDVVLSAGQNVTDINFGNFQRGKIDGYKFNDLNSNGIWDKPAEPALADWDINMDGPGANDSYVTTNADGFFAFWTPVPGDYTIWETNQNGWIQTAPTPHTAVVTATSGMHQVIDFGNHRDNGTVTFEKVVRNFPSADLSDFHFAVNGQGDYQNGDNAAFTTKNGYVVTENTVDHYRLVGASGICSYNADTQQVTMDVTANGGICTIINERNLGKVTVIKIVDGGNADPKAWSFHAANATGLTSGDSFTVPVGDYPIAEYNGVDGYTLTGMHGACTLGTGQNLVFNFSPSQGYVHVTEADSICYVTNTRNTGSITVNKMVDLKGDGNFTSMAGEATPFRWQYNGGSDRYMGSSVDGLPTTVSDSPVYTITENSVTNFHPIGWFYNDDDASCTNQELSSLPASLEVTKDDTTEITICNARDTGTIELKKHWEGTAGATVLKVGTESGAEDVLMAEISGADGTTGQKEVVTRTYYNSETPITNYTPSPLFCFNDANNNGVNDDDVSPIIVGEHDSVYVGINQHIICSYTNTRNTGSIKVNKMVNYADGEGFVDANGESSPFRWGIDPSTGTDVIDDGDTNRLMGTTETGLLTNSDYTVTEKSVTGYHPVGWFYNNSETSCTDPELRQLPAIVTITGNNEITICNVRDTATLTLVKNVDNANGGTALATAWTLSASGNTPIAGSTGSTPVTNATVIAGTYTLSESGGSSGYTPSLFSCVKKGGIPVSANSVTLVNGDDVICTITNDDIQPKLTVTKVVVNDNGGTKVVTDFPLFVNATSVTSGVQNGFNVGAYTISETTSAGYAASITGDCATNGTITLNPGDEKSCTITNNDTAPSLTVIKHVVNGTIGTKVAANFTMNVSGTNVSTPSFPGAEAGTTVTMNAGSYGVTEPATAGYAQSLSADCSGTIAVGQTKTCTVTNTAIAPILSITKSNDIIGFTNPGKQVTYTITVTNTTTATDIARNVNITDTLPAGFTFADTGLATKTTAAGDLAIGQSKPFTFLVNIATGQTAGTYTNTANAKGDNTPTVTATSPVEVRVPAVLGVTIEPTLVLTKTVDTTVTNPGKTITYTVTISNPGDTDITNVSLDDKLPKGFVFADTGKDAKTWSIGTLKAHHQRVINYLVKVKDNVKAGKYTNLATVLSDQLNPQTAKATVEVKVPKVLGLATTGVSMRDYITFAFGLGLMSLGLYWIGRLRRREYDADSA